MEKFNLKSLLNASEANMRMIPCIANTLLFLMVAFHQVNTQPVETTYAAIKESNYSIEIEESVDENDDKNTSVYIIELPSDAIAQHIPRTNFLSIKIKWQMPIRSPPLLKAAY